MQCRDPDVDAINPAADKLPWTETDGEHDFADIFCPPLLSLGSAESHNEGDTPTALAAMARIIRQAASESPVPQPCMDLSTIFDAADYPPESDDDFLSHLLPLTSSSMLVDEDSPLLVRPPSPVHRSNGSAPLLAHKRRWGPSSQSQLQPLSAPDYPLNKRLKLSRTADFNGTSGRPAPLLHSSLGRHARAKRRGSDAVAESSSLHPSLRAKEASAATTATRLSASSPSQSVLSSVDSRISLRRAFQSLSPLPLLDLDLLGPLEDFNTEQLSSMAGRLKDVAEEYGYIPSYPCTACGITCADQASLITHRQQDHRAQGGDDFDTPPPPAQEQLASASDAKRRTALSAANGNHGLHRMEEGADAGDDTESEASDDDRDRTAAGDKSDQIRLNVGNSSVGAAAAAAEPATVAQLTCQNGSQISMQLTELLQKIILETEYCCPFPGCDSSGNLLKPEACHSNLRSCPRRAELQAVAESGKGLPALAFAPGAKVDVYDGGPWFRGRISKVYNDKLLVIKAPGKEIEVPADLAHNVGGINPILWEQHVAPKSYRCFVEDCDATCKGPSSFLYHFLSCHPKVALMVRPTTTFSTSG